MISYREQSLTETLDFAQEAAPPKLVALWGGTRPMESHTWAEGAVSQVNHRQVHMGKERNEPEKTRQC